MNQNLPQLHPTEDAAPAPVPAVVAGGGLAALFATHVLRDGELVLLILKPSLWFIPIQACLFAGVVALFAAGAALAGGLTVEHDRVYFELAVILIAGRLMWAALQWQGRLYVLTNLRILRLGGVFVTDIFDCPLRKISSARLVAGARESLLALGSIEIQPEDDTRPPPSWQTVARPRQVHEKVVAAITRAKQ